MKEEDLTKEYLDQEECYRRGYRQGFYSARKNPDITFQEVSEWSHDLRNDSFPPGSWFDIQKQETIHVKLDFDLDDSNDNLYE